MADKGFDDVEADFINSFRPGAITKTGCRRIGIDPPPLSDTLLMLSDVRRLRCSDTTIEPHDPSRCWCFA